MAKVHRFFVGKMQFGHEVWVRDPAMLHQWNRVLRFNEGRELILFNDTSEECLYKISKIGLDAVQLHLVTNMQPLLPKIDVYLCFSLLKKDKNDWVMQKGTELGIRHFLPLLADRTEKTGFDVERAAKIVTEAAEQCGRSDIPRVREPMKPMTAIAELSEKASLYVAEQGGEVPSRLIKEVNDRPIAVFIGPEGGWTPEETQQFAKHKVQHLNLSNFTLRAETAAITAAALLQ